MNPLDPDEARLIWTVLGTTLAALVAVLLVLALAGCSA